MLKFCFKNSTKNNAIQINFMCISKLTVKIKFGGQIYAPNIRS